MAHLGLHLLTTRIHMKKGLNSEKMKQLKIMFLQYESEKESLVMF